MLWGLTAASLPPAGWRVGPLSEASAGGAAVGRLLLALLCDARPRAPLLSHVCFVRNIGSAHARHGGAGSSAAAAAAAAAAALRSSVWIAGPAWVFAASGVGRRITKRAEPAVAAGASSAGGGCRCPPPVAPAWRWSNVRIISSHLQPRPSGRSV